MERQPLTFNGIFRYPGGKSKRSVKDKIFSKFPINYTEYREPFVGGGGIYWAIPSCKNRWINDINVNIISVYKALRDRPQEFISNCKAIEPHQKTDELVAHKEGGNAIHNKRLKEIFECFAKDEDMDAALRYFFINRTVWAGRVNYKIPSRLYFSNANGWNIVKTDKLEHAARILKNTKITNISYEDVILAEGKDVLIYLDPPYVVNSNLAKTSQLYEDNFALEDHLKLKEVLDKTTHRFILSYDKDNDGIVKNLYKSYNVYQDEWTYCGTSNSKKKIGKELIITNF